MAGEKILIVEDEMITGCAISQQLKRLGYEVTDLVNSGRAALDSIAQTLPDLVLMDIVLKNREFDGIAAAAQIRSQFKIPVIYLTAHSEEVILARAKETEPFGYIVKPFNQRDLRIGIEIGLYKHKMERQLAEREELLSTILHSTSDGVIATDEKGCIAYMNPVAETMTGWQSGEALGKSITEVVQIMDEVTDTMVQNPVMLLLEGETIDLSGNHRLLIARDGRKIPIADSVSHLRKESDTTKGAVLVFWDISEHRKVEDLALEKVRLSTEIIEREKAEAEVRKALMVEQELSELKSRLIGTISHEYRTPLAVILTSTELLKRYGYKLSEEKKETYLDRIQAGVRQMDQLLEEILTFRKIESDELELNLELLDVQEFCRELIDNQQHQVGDRYQIDLTVRGFLDYVNLDRELLRHIVGNLLSNAIKYSPKGTMIDCLLVGDKDRVIFQVKDRGIGIPKMDQICLFSPFFRASNVSTIAGTGMGLSIVKKCVDLHRGEIAIESEVDVGTTVTVSLPRL